MTPPRSGRLNAPTGSGALPGPTGLVDLLDAAVRDRPGSPALIVGPDRLPLSYGGLDRLADDMAAQLASTGLRPGDPVGLVCAGTAEFPVALLGAARAGLVTAPLDPALPVSQLAARVSALGARALLAGPGTTVVTPGTEAPDVGVPVWPVTVEVLPGAGSGTVVLDAGKRAAPGGGGAAGELTPADALVLSTAGTTGQAKLVPLTRANVAAGVSAVTGTYGLGPADGTVAAMPFFHGHGLFATLLASLATGGRVVLPARGKFSAHTFWDDLAAADGTWFTAVPTIHQILLARSATEYPGQRARPLRFVRSCSAPLPDTTGRALEELLGAPVLSAYGMTESTHQATGEPPRPPDPSRPRGSVGPPTGVDLRITGPDGQASAPGAEGEVWVRGPSVVRGYLGDRKTTADSFADGWFRTGDLGRLDQDGRLFLTGRIKDLINRGGEKISPEHVEDILAGCPGVAEAAVFPVPDPTYGELVGAAVVILGSDADADAEAEAGEGEAGGPATGEAEAAGRATDAREPDRQEPAPSDPSLRILRYCRTRLAPFEVPEQIRVVAALPHTAKGGLDRRALRARYAS
ncbi:FadD7 family fatty acid--CoA ligase [Streptomyces sp. NPDC059477]|uniref:FadD7 family fatty acid--CoA ligase n=1 Tax=Streptomyces sp. NPDC059477 TaxID=3346847 RepID=UPI00368CDC52